MTKSVLDADFKKIETSSSYGKTKSIINHPDHYTWHPSGVECATIAEHMPYNIGVAVAYLWRHRHKGTAIDDLRKAMWHINREIERLGRHEGEKPDESEPAVW